MVKGISVVTCVTLLRAHEQKLDNTPSNKLPLEPFRKTSFPLEVGLLDDPTIHF
jgi:hypothetical protein